MPKKKNINKVMIIGSGPIIIGQACEFDYSGTQACKALKSLGYKIVLVNSNPATIMTDPATADVVYIEPLNVESMEWIIKKEKPDALLPNLGGQSALNLTSELQKEGILEKYNVEIIGVNIDAIKRGEDRTAFKETMEKIGVETPRSRTVTSVSAAEEIGRELGFPVVIRPAYTMGGTGGGLVYNVEELRIIAARGIAASMVNQILVEESVLGWEELELEVVRDAKNQMVTVCFIENVDAMGVHTGDSFCTAPMLTIDEKVQKKLQAYSYAIVEAIEVIGGTNIQFAHNPETGRVVVIEINPRTSRSSALASKATGFPIALVSALLAGGMTLDEIPYWRDGTLEKYTPGGDYVVVKFARWAFEKFEGVEDKLGTQMRAVGEVMSIGKTYKEALQKAIRSLEMDRYGLGFAADFHRKKLEELMILLNTPSSERQFIIYEALRQGAGIEDIYKKTHIKPWFLNQMKELVVLEKEIMTYAGRINEIPDELMISAKKDGFCDKYLAKLLKTTETVIREKRKSLGMKAVWDSIPVSGVENAVYYYSTYHSDRLADKNPGDPPDGNKKKIMVLGGGPNRIGQGIEFDYCCVHAAFAIRDGGYESIMVNCNPETVSTDYDTADKLYFEPLTVEDVLAIYEKEKPEGVVVQFGGQSPLNIAGELAAAGVNILGTPPETIDQAEDRDSFKKTMKKLGIPQPDAEMARSVEEALGVAEHIGYPLMVRPSFVLGGRAMMIVYDEEMLRHYMEKAVEISPERPILIDKFLENAIEAEADAVADGSDAFVPAVMEHIELAGIHSGDSACVIPPVSIPVKHTEIIREYTKKIAIELGVVGLMNIQYAIADDIVYILEANPRASRTVPLVSKVCNVSMARIATQIMLGRKLADFDLKTKAINHFGVKEAVFPFNMFPEVDPLLGPEMRSTGEVLGMADSFGMAFYRAQEATKIPLPLSGTVLITLAEADKPKGLEAARLFYDLGFNIMTTGGTHDFLKNKGLVSTVVNKRGHGKPDIVDVIKAGQVELVFNTPSGKESQEDDSYIRKAAINYQVPYITTTAAALSAVKGIKARREGRFYPKSLQEYHADIN